MNQKLILLFVLFLASISLNAQNEKTLARKGNELYEAKKYDEAEKKYKASLEKKKDFIESQFNLGDALYQQGKYEEAAAQFDQIIQSNPNKEISAKAYHNLGNSYLQSKKYKESIDAYKKSLKQNPNDNDTRHNLSYAMTKLQQQQQNNKDKNKDNKDKDKEKDKNKEESDKKEEQKKDDKKDDKKDQENKENNNDSKENKQEDKEQQGKPDPKKISEGDAKRMLEALNQQEKNVQKKLSNKKSQEIQVDKNW